MDVTTQDDLKAHLMATDEQFRQLAIEHSKYDQLIDALESNPVLTGDEEAEEHRLKKLKLRLKDQMTELMNRYKAQNVA